MLETWCRFGGWWTKFGGIMGRGVQAHPPWSATHTHRCVSGWKQRCAFQCYDMFLVVSSCSLLLFLVVGVVAVVLWWSFVPHFSQYLLRRTEGTFETTLRHLRRRSLADSPHNALGMFQNFFWGTIATSAIKFLNSMLWHASNFIVLNKCGWSVHSRIYWPGTRGDSTASEQFDSWRQNLKKGTQTKGVSFNIIAKK